jgi:TonB family protein
MLRYVVPAAVLGLLVLLLWFGRRGPGTPSDVGAAPAVQVEPPKTAPPQVKPVESPPPKAAAAPPKSKARAGDVLWTEVANQVIPDATRKARSTIRGKVTVSLRVQVNPAGEVTDATLESPDASRYFTNLSLQAARKWKFRPVRVADQDAAQEWTLRFEFTRNGTTAYPARLSP